MPTPRKAGRFGGSAAHHRLIVANLATELFRHGRIRTTHAKAKTVQPTAERLITFAKRGDVHSRRQARKIVRDRDVLHHLFADVGPAFADRDGGYTRVLKLGPRKGDAAPMALVELVADVAAPGHDGDDQPRRRWNLRRQRAVTETGAPAGPGTAEQEPADAEAASLEADGADDDERPEADPAEVEARLAAEDAEAEGSETGDDAAAAADDADQGEAAARDEDEDQGRS